MQEFISRIVSSSGFICIATPGLTFKGFEHYKLDTVDKAVWIANKIMGEGRDVYFACGTLREKSIEVAGKKRSRCAENILEMKSLFLDLDVGENKPYKTQAEAITHLMKFVKDIGMPRPMVVSSGYGVHVYWPFTQAIPADKWRVLAAHFKAVTQAYGLHADPMRTADVSSVLRLPGTLNFKNPAAPREVKVIVGKTPPQDTSPKTLVQIIAAASKNLNTTATVAPTRAAAAPDTGLGSFEVAQEPASFKDIVKKCQQVRAAYINQETVSEPVWFATLQLVRHCQDPEKNAHATSKRYPKYNPAEVDTKLASLTEKNVGPTLCSTFDSRNPSGCDGCEHRGKINTPLVLGRSLKEATDNPTMVIDHGNGESSTVELPKPPYPYMRTTSGAIAIRCKDEKGKEIDPEVIYDYDIHPTKRMYDEVEQTEVFFFRSWLPQDGWREYPVPAHLIYDERKLMEVMARQGVLPDMAQKSRLIGYMLGYIQSLQRQQPADQIYSQMGWRKNDTEVVIGNTSFSPKGQRKIKVAEQFARVLPKFEASGTLDKWKEVVDIYNHKGFEEYAFALMMGFGQLLFKFSGYSGSLYNLYGDAGAGKSTVLRLIHSIYGTPTETSLLHHDTTNAKIAMIGCYNNLPITYDEVTNIDPHELSDLCFAVSNGRGKEALKQDRTLRENTATWQTTMYMTSNSPLMPKLINLKGTTSGETYRLMERRVHKPAKFNLESAREALEPLNTNYGHAGRVIAEWLANNVDAAKDLMAKAYKEVSQLAEAQSQERFWVGMCAQAVVGARLGQMLGLHNYNVEQILQHAVTAIREARGVMVSEVKTPVDVLVEYFNTNLSVTLASKTNRAGMEEAIRKPVHSLMIRHEQDSGRIYVTKSHFKDWCVERHYDANSIMEHMEASGVMLNPHVSKSLGDGTEFSTGRVSCMLLDAHHTSVSGAAALRAVEAA
jgi:hypothetical protein